MAYSQTPVENTSQTKRIPIVVGETLASNVKDANAYQGQRYVNCYPKRTGLANADDKWVLTKTAAWVEEERTFASSGTDTIKCVSSDGFYLWKGKRLYSTALTPSLAYTATNTITVYSMFRVTNASSTTALYAGVFYDNTAGTVHSYTWDGTTFTQSSAISNTVLSSGPSYAPNVSAYFNGRLFLIGTGARIFNTGPGAYTTWNSTWFISPEMTGDELVALVVYKSFLVSFNTQSMEFFYDAGIDIGSPLQRQDSYFQKYGVRNNFNIVSIGDLVYFLSWEERTGWGVYTIDNYVVTKISNLYVDTLLSNADATGNLPYQVNFCLMDQFGDSCLVLYRTFEPYWQGGLAYSSKQKVWFEITFPDQTPGIVPVALFQWAQNATLPEWLTYFVSSTAYSSNLVTFYYLSKDYSPTTSVTAEYIEDITDLGTQRWKHFTSVYFVGDPGNNTVELSWTPSMDYSNWSSFYSRSASGNLDEFLRWDNIGRFRRIARRWRFDGTSNISMDGSEIRYNLGTN